uniref:Enoyl-CoA hydratase domain containing 2 n=1 Tax=Equus asinus TaxID=9793 RepID=A0A8C4PPK0_EQUAS
MLRPLTSALRLLRPWKPLQTRGCASDEAARGREIQVRALEGPDQGITEILMNRPRARNALGNVFVSELLEALAQLREDRQVRVLLFRSAVKGVFCAGADLKEREQMSEAEVEVFVQRLRGMMTEIAAFPAPTIAALDGFALGGGLELALACDLRVAGGTQRLPRCLGVALAKELIFTGRRLSGTQAQVLGLVNHAVAQNEEGNAAYHRARALAQEILPQAPIAVRLSKVAIDRGMEVDIASGMAIEGICYAQKNKFSARREYSGFCQEEQLSYQILEKSAPLKATGSPGLAVRRQVRWSREYQGEERRGASGIGSSPSALTSQTKNVPLSKTDSSDSHC